MGKLYTDNSDYQVLWMLFAIHCPQKYIQSGWSECLLWHENLWHILTLTWSSMWVGKGFLNKHSPDTPAPHTVASCISDTSTETRYLRLPLEARLSIQLLAARIGFKSEVDFRLTTFPPKDLGKKKILPLFIAFIFSCSVIINKIIHTFMHI